MIRRICQPSIIIILFAWSFLALFRLGEKALWTDEILVSLASKHSVPYIFDRSKLSDIHPPGYCYIIKAWGLIHDSDGFLRLFSVLCAVGAMIVLYKIGCRLISRHVGLYSMVLMASNLLFLSEARQVRPYTLLIFMYLVAIYSYVLAKINKNWFWLCVLILMIVPMIHFSTFLLSFSLLLYFAYDHQFLVNTLKNSKFFSVCSMVACLMTYGLSLSIYLARSKLEVGAPGSLCATGGNILAGINYVLSSSWQLNWTTFVITVLFSYGMFILYKTNKDVFFLSFVYIMTPIVILLIFRYSSYSNPWHYMYLLPLVCLSAAVALDKIPVPSWVVVTICAISFASGLYEIYSKLYKDDSDSVKRLASALARDKTHDLHYLFNQELLFNSVARYLPEPKEEFYRQRMGPEQDVVSLISVGEQPLDGMICSRSPDFKGVSQCTVNRKKFIDLHGQPDKVVVNFDPLHFYSQAFSSEYIQIDQSFGSKLMPTQNNVTAKVNYRFQNDFDFYPYVAAIVLDYEVSSKGSTINVFSKTDTESETLVFSTGKTTGRTKTPIYMVFDKAFKFLELRIEMNCAESHAGFGGNLSTVNVRGITLYLGCYKNAARIN